MNWSLDTAEQSLAIATTTARPAIFAFNGPITTIDQLLCKGIDIVEQRVPAVHLPPHLVSFQIPFSNIIIFDIHIYFYRGGYIHIFVKKYNYIHIYSYQYCIMIYVLIYVCMIITILINLFIILFIVINVKET